MEKRGNLSRLSYIFHSGPNTEKLSHSLRFVRKGIAATKHVDQNKDSDAEIYYWQLGKNEP